MPGDDQTIEFFLAPWGNDNADGLSPYAQSSSGPFASIERALTGVRDERENRQFDVRVGPWFSPSCHECCAEG